ncbi:MAG: iron-containing alcohol dehydrogenase [Chlorobiaceae bacterium]|nr:iron-containing alcohol dehydrogenase [Chlorobiaceae bacterium]
MSSDTVPCFSLLPLPRIHFGQGEVSMLPGLCSGFGKHLLLVTGSSALKRSGRLSRLLGAFAGDGFQVLHLPVGQEPSADLIDRTVLAYRGRLVDVVVAIGGGSVLDAGKAISAMLMQRHPVERFIEGREGVIPHDGRKVPFIAVPTTSGTGSEVTNNAVISRVGPGGYKRSLRHEAFVPDVALIDPELMTSAPPGLTASSGMDACTQLLEAYLSPYASPYTDAVALSGLERFSRSFMSACSTGAGDPVVRADIAYAALMSGIALANAGLGIVHGFASSIGGSYDIPHGTLCATLLAESTKVNIEGLRRLDSRHPALEKFAMVGGIVAGAASRNVEEGCGMLVEQLEAWQDGLGFPRLGEFGVREAELDGIVAVTRSKSNAVDLDTAAMRSILAARL